MPKGLYAIESRFNIKQGGGQPALSLVGVLPGIDFATALFNQGIDRLKTIGGLKRTPKHPIHTQVMQGEGFLKTFCETGRGRLVALIEFLMKPLEGATRLGIRGPVIGVLQAFSPTGLLAF